MDGDGAGSLVARVTLRLVGAAEREKFPRGVDGKADQGFAAQPPEVPVTVTVTVPVVAAALADSVSTLVVVAGFERSWH